MVFPFVGVVAEMRSKRSDPKAEADEEDDQPNYAGDVLPGAVQLDLLCAYAPQFQVGEERVELRVPLALSGKTAKMLADAWELLVMKRIGLAGCVAAVLMAGGAWAEGQVTLGRDGSTYVFVWRDEEAFSEGMKLVRAHVHETNPALVFQLISCVANPGDHAIETDPGFASSTIVVVDGDNAGCRGLVTREDIR